MPLVVTTLLAQVTRDDMTARMLPFTPVCEFELICVCKVKLALVRAVVAPNAVLLLQALTSFAQTSDLWRLS